MPLKKIDKYVLKNFVIWFGVCMIAMMGLYIVVDLFLRLYKFFKFPGNEVFFRIVKYYFWNTPFQFLEFLPMVTLMAGMFTVAMMAKNNELVPIMASGISTYRITSVIFICATVVMIGMFVTQEWFIVAYADTIAEATDKPRTEARSMKELKIDGSRRHIFRYRNFDPVSEEMSNVTVRRWIIAPGKDKYTQTNYIYAKKAYFGKAQLLTFKNGSSAICGFFVHEMTEDEILVQTDSIFRIFNTRDIAVDNLTVKGSAEKGSLELKNGSVVSGSRIPRSYLKDAIIFRTDGYVEIIPKKDIKEIKNIETWILHKGVNLDYRREQEHDRTPWQFRFGEGYDMAVLADLRVRDLKIRKTEPRFKTMAELHRQIKMWPAYDTWKIVLFKRITLPLTNLILLLVGLPFVMRPTNKSVFTSLGVCILIFLCYYIISFICHDLGAHKRMPPALAVSLPLIIFTAVGIYKFDSMKT